MCFDISLNFDQCGDRYHYKFRCTASSGDERCLDWTSLSRNVPALCQYACDGDGQLREHHIERDLDYGHLCLVGSSNDRYVLAVTSQRSTNSESRPISFPHVVCEEEFVQDASDLMPGTFTGAFTSTSSSSLAEQPAPDPYGTGNGSEGIDVEVESESQYQGEDFPIYDDEQDAANSVPDSEMTTLHELDLDQEDHDQESVDSEEPVIVCSCQESGMSRKRKADVLLSNGVVMHI